jgi:transcriptional regulator with GAF, ATPase, and Fis domain
MAKDSEPPESASLTRVAEEVASIFQVKPDEVAILALLEKDRLLRFVLPEKLQAVGTIPTSSTGALAARTARDKRAEVINNFAATRHASVFEGVPLGRHGESIHKIMSAPIMAEGKVVGVVQISRKGRNAVEAGADFTPKDLRELSSLSAVLSRFIRLCLPC